MQVPGRQPRSGDSALPALRMADLRRLSILQLQPLIVVHSTLPPIPLFNQSLTTQNTCKEESLTHRERSCLRKLRHVSYFEALQHAKRVPNNDTVVVYGCDYCGWHHVGHSVAFHKLAKTERRIFRAKEVLSTEVAPELQERNRQRIRDLEKNLARLKKQLQCMAHEVREAA
jgi:hypothetical protein